MVQEFYRPGDPVGDILFNWLPFLAAAGAVLLGLFFILRGYRLYLNSAYLARSGHEGRARVIKKWVQTGRVDREERHSSRPLKHYYLHYQLLDDPRAFSVEEVAPVDLWNEVETGDEVDVIYHPTRPLMRLAAWKSYNGLAGGGVQMGIGAVITSVAAAAMISGAFDALTGPEQRRAEEHWARDTAEVLQIGAPADPYLRVFAPGSKMIHVAFGDTNGGAFLGNLRVIRVTPQQIAAFDIREGAILNAWIDPENEFNAILDLERPDAGIR